MPETGKIGSAAQAKHRLQSLQGQINPNPQLYDHPLDPLTVAEISVASTLIKARHIGKRFQFRYVTLVEPPKREMVVYLDAEKAGQKPQRPDRIAEYVTGILGPSEYQMETNYYCLFRRATYSIFNNESGWSYIMYEAIVNLSTNTVVQENPFPEGVVESLSVKSMGDAQDVLMASQEFKDAISKLNLPKNIVIEIDP